MRQMISLAIGSINQATAGYSNAGGEGLSLVSLDETTLQWYPIAHHTIANPSFLSVNPLSHIIYATQEISDEEEGQISALTFSMERQEITLLGSQPTGGRIPAHNMVTGDRHFVLVANYGSRLEDPDFSLSVLPIASDGRITPYCDGVKLHGVPGPVPDRQHRSHAHMVMETASGAIFVADLGLDLLIQYHLNSQGKLTEIARLNLPAGCAPRHMVQHPRAPLLYIVGELDSTVNVIAQEARGFELVQTLSTLGSQVQSYAADIHLSPDGKFLYISNRGEDSLSCFAVDEVTGLLNLRQIIATGGQFPRNFALTPSGQHLLVAHQNSEAITLLRRDADTGKLTLTDKTIAIANAVCIKCF